MDDIVAFARGVPGPDLVPAGELASAAERVFSAAPAAALSYGPPAGYLPLRRMLGEWHGVPADRIMLTNGSLQGFALVVQALIQRSGVELVVERPTYDRPLDLLHRFGVSTSSIDLDADGARVGELPTTGTVGDVLAYVIPSFHNPGGVTLTEARREELAAWTSEPGRWTFEDDPYGRLYFDEPPPAPVFERTQGRRVVYASSFSKTVAPGVRAGYLILPEELIEPVTQLAASTYICPTTLTAAIVHEFLASDAFEPWLATVRAALAERCSALCDALDTHMPDAQYTRPTGGYFVWVRMPGTTDTRLLLETAQQAGVTFVAGADFGDGLSEYVRLAFSAHAPDEIQRGVERLASVFAAETARA